MFLRMFRFSLRCKKPCMRAFRSRTTYRATQNQTHRIWEEYVFLLGGIPLHGKGAVHPDGNAKLRLCRAWTSKSPFDRETCYYRPPWTSFFRQSIKHPKPSDFLFFVPSRDNTQIWSKKNTTGNPCTYFGFGCEKKIVHGLCGQGHRKSCSPDLKKNVRN